MILLQIPRIRDCGMTPFSQRERVRSLESECALLREKNGRLEAELAHAR